MKKKLLFVSSILIGIFVLGGIFGGSSKPQFAGTQMVATPTPIIVPQTSVQPTLESTQNTNSGLSNDNTYVNSTGNTVHSPAYSNSIPAGATAQCDDGTYSFSQHRQGTCSQHGGVSQWL